MIQALLLDADGVVQSTGPSFWSSLGGLIAHEDKYAFFDAVFAVEEKCLSGRLDFARELERLLGQWGSEASVDQALRAWHDIRVDATVLPLVAVVRSCGVICCVASNQQPYRARHMSQVLGFSQLFDRELYSHAIGAAETGAAVRLSDSGCARSSGGAGSIR